VVLNLDAGIDVDQIATLKPDLIVAIDAGVDADTYQKLSAIAPTVPQSGTDAFFEPWQDQATTIGTAVFQSDAMVASSRPSMTGSPRWARQPAVQGQAGAAARGAAVEQQVVATLPGWRTDFLTRMGFTIPSITSHGTDDHRAVLPVDQAAAVLDDADVLIWTTEATRTRRPWSPIRRSPGCGPPSSTGMCSPARILPVRSARLGAFLPAVADQLPLLSTALR
jgi:iron complex transport system substrate-binding protein